jgi:two-component system, chemotaxis family, chemotaxis protein CheY
MRFFFDYKTKNHSIYDYNGNNFKNSEDAFNFGESTAQLLKNSFNGDWIGYSVEVRDALGKKYFSIPIGPSDTSASETQTGLHHSYKQAIRLLIIEDRHVHGAVIGRSAVRLGFAITHAHDYDNACEILCKQHFDCITLDLGLGDHVGYDVIRHLANIQSRAQIIVISETEKEIRDDMVEIGRALALNVCGSIQKPIDLCTLREMFLHIQGHLPPQDEMKELEEVH